MFFRLLWYAFSRRLVWLEYVTGGAERCRIKWVVPGWIGIESAICFGDQDTYPGIIPTRSILGIREGCVEYERERLEAAWQNDNGLIIEVELEEYDEDDTEE